MPALAGCLHEDARMLAVTDWDAVYTDPAPVILRTTSLRAGCAERQASWYVLRYVSGQEAEVQRCVEKTDLPLRMFTYRFRTNRTRHRKARYVTRSWTPGYAFVELDLKNDLWQELLRVRHVLTILGGPTPLPPVGPGSMVDLVARLPENPEKPHAETSIKAGTVVRIDAGPFAKFSGPVIRSDRKHVMLMPMIFGRPTELTLSVRDISVIG